jgi:hypothetical protein
MGAPTKREFESDAARRKFAEAVALAKRRGLSWKHIEQLTGYCRKHLHEMKSTLCDQAVSKKNVT